MQSFSVFSWPKKVNKKILNFEHLFLSFVLHLFFFRKKFVFRSGDIWPFRTFGFLLLLLMQFCDIAGGARLLSTSTKVRDQDIIFLHCA